MSAFRKAVQKVGTLAFARRVGEKPATVSNWLARGQVPMDKCVKVERALQGQVSRRELRPRDWRRLWPELRQSKDH